MPGVRITGGAFIGANSYIGANYLISTAVRLDENSVVEMSKL
jgi:UDP-3-O-[3-hydroxymyristoyl] glucosamine N-acyltransferase